MAAHHQAAPPELVGGTARVSVPKAGRPVDAGRDLDWTRLTTNNASLMLPDMSYRTGFRMFRRHGEAFLVVSPQSLLLHVANAELIKHMATHREQFPKWTASYSILRQFGENIVTCEGQTWRTHRKVTSPTFNERNSALVFREAIIQTQGMIRTWVGPSGPTKETLRTLEKDTMRLALNIIGYVGFGMRLLWPGQTLPPTADPGLLKYGSLDAPAGHSLSFVDTMSSVMENLLLLLVLPHWLLGILPWPRAKESVVAYADYIKYMDELMEDKLEEARAGSHAEGMDLMGQLVRTTYAAREASSAKGAVPVLGRQEIIGNAFVMFVAGHETTANTLHFAMVELATNPSMQRRVQKDIDELLGDAEPDSWDYDDLVNPMTASMVGACMYETLRILPPVCELPKKVSPLRDEAVSVDGRSYVVPKDTSISMSATSVHLNPRYWPHGTSTIHADERDDLRDFKPERWFRPSVAASNAGGRDDVAVAEAEWEQYGGYTGPDTNAQLFRPERGAYIPFSDGARSCLGRRIAQVEIIAALAVLFQKYSLELAVDEWATEAEVEGMSRTALAAVYRQAQDKSRAVISQASSIITLKLHGELHVPVRVVKRGEERFVSWMDDDGSRAPTA
ncbi:hypothetical protein DCS_01815 [Drechmeria coniospora]|uniref:Cytochrome P450 n=1 Tax=Drechmeria coniospora TaxID=98403 RepID=A0A151GUA4_DRECN|nr:hypothetical protein DCS_01815 [Drechmeria coniospora]KYK60677.1 hypothetical protein DCS_01815 [Drechmeria coniospora]